MQTRPWMSRAAALVLLLIFATELFLSIRHQSLSWDEGDHIFAGYQAWKAGDFGINPEHPPFVKELATLPMLAMHLRTPPPAGKPFFKDEAYFDGRNLIYGNGGLGVANRILLSVRLTAALLSLLMASLVWAAARQMYGEAAALFALALVVFEPNLIAHGAYVTTDMGVTCFLFGTLYALYRVRERPSWPRIVVLGVATGLALASKHSAVLLLPIAVTTVALDLLLPGGGVRRAALARVYAKATAAAVAIALVLLWSTYGFRFSARPHGVHMKPSLTEYMRPLHGLEPRVYALLAHLHLLPESYIYGLVDVRIVSDTFPSYIFGQIHAHGVPYYFPAAFIIKCTAAFLLLLLIAAYALLSRRLPADRRVLFLLAPPLVYLAVAMGTGLNIGARHILPMLPFLAVWVAGAVVMLARRHRGWAWAAGALLAWHAVSTTLASPQYIAYSNEFWGGPAQTYRYLTDSNVDWGQQLRDVKTYIDRRGIRQCWFAYFVTPEIDFHDYGIPCKALPTADSVWAHTQIDTPPVIDGPVLISAGTLTGYEFGTRVYNPYDSFVGRKPVAQIDDGVFVYDGTFPVPRAHAFGFMTRANELLAAGNAQGAFVQARQAVAADSSYFGAQLALGDAAAALHRPDDARAAYERALAMTTQMEPSARAQWTATLQGKLAALPR